MKPKTKEELIQAIDDLSIQLDRVIKIPMLLGEPENTKARNKLIDKIQKLSNELSKL
jgi:hypothetical protein